MSKLEMKFGESYLQQRAKRPTDMAIRMSPSEAIWWLEKLRVLEVSSYELALRNESMKPYRKDNEARIAALDCAITALMKARP